MLKDIARYEAGLPKGNYPLTDQQWQAAQQIAFDDAAAQCLSGQQNIAERSTTDEIGPPPIRVR
jgi:hypothetical protein